MENNNEYITTPTGLVQVNPEVAFNESNQFVQTLRDVAKANNNEISTQTYNLGSQLPSSQGGLGGATNTFVSRYQTPQVNTTIENLRAVNQAKLLSDAMANNLAEMQNQYKNAYRSAYKRATNPSTNNPSGNTGDVEITNPDVTTTESSISSIPGKRVMVDADGIQHIIDLETGEEETVDLKNISSSNKNRSLLDYTIGRITGSISADEPWITEEQYYGLNRK